VTATTATSVRSPLRALLTDTRVLRLFGASMVARLPLGATGIVLILHVRALTGSYAAGGLAAGVNSLAFGATAPALGRLVDRRGQTGVLLAGALVAAAALLALALLPPAAPLAAVLALCALAGAAVPPLGSCLRVLWTEILPDADRVHAAYAFESVALEFTYVLGPLVVAGAIATHSPPAALVTCAVLLLAGTAAFASTAESRAARPSTAERSRGGALRSPAVRALLLSFAFVALTFGVVEVATAAFAEAAGRRGAAGPLLGAWGVGSMIGGLWAARGGVPADPPRRLALLYGVLAAGYVPLLLPTGVLAMVPLMALAGVAIGPSIATAYGILGRHAPDGTATEAFAWAGTAFGGGLAAGAALGGALVDGHGASAGFALAAAGAAAAAAVVALRRRALTG
jgi:MFS family permease